MDQVLAWITAHAVISDTDHCTYNTSATRTSFLLEETTGAETRTSFLLEEITGAVT